MQCLRCFYFKGFPNNKLKFSNLDFGHLCANSIDSSTITRKVHVNYTAKRPSRENVYWTIHNLGLFDRKNMLIRNV